MTQEDKELLLKDLCTRLPYGVIVRHADYLIDSDGNYTGQFWYKRGYLYNICRMDNMTTTIIESEGSDEEGLEYSFLDNQVDIDEQGPCCSDSKLMNLFRDNIKSETSENELYQHISNICEKFIYG